MASQQQHQQQQHHQQYQQQPQQQSSSSGKGCSIFAVIIVAVLCLIFGFIAGAGALYGYLASDSSSYESLGLSPPTETEKVVVEKSSDSADSKSGDQQMKPYPLAYPIQETLRVQGKIDEDMIRQVVADERFDLGGCYKEVLASNSDIKGEMSLQMTVAPKSGKVMAAVVRQNMTGSDELESCIVEELKTWKFDPKKVEGGLTVVRFDALFLPITGKNAPRP